MILPKGVQPWLACSGDTVKYALVCPWFVGNSVCSSDGKTLIVTPVTEYEGDVPGPIPVEALKEAFKHSKKGMNYYLSLKEEYVQTMTGKQYPRWGGMANDQLKGQTFPPCEPILKDADKLKRTVSFGIDAARLLDAAKAGGHYGKNGQYFVYLNLHVGKDGKVEKVIDIEIGDYYEPKSRVLVMPVSK